MRWTRENTFDTIINTEASTQGIEAALIKATIGQESAFVPTAKRAEPKINDASYGLMQLLYRTAQALGYTGTPEGLYDPAVNVHYGTMLLAQNLSRTNGDIPRAVSAYNGGFRESLGFGRQLPNGQFRNQDYVNRVLANLKYFRQQAAQPSTPSAQEAGAATTAGTVAGALFSALLLGILWLLRRGSQ